MNFNIIAHLGIMVSINHSVVTKINRTLVEWARCVVSGMIQLCVVNNLIWSSPYDRERPHLKR